MESNFKIRKATETDLDTIIQFNINMAWETEEKKLPREKLNLEFTGCSKNRNTGFI